MNLHATQWRSQLYGHFTSRSPTPAAVTAFHAPQVQYDDDVGTSAPGPLPERPVLLLQLEPGGSGSSGSAPATDFGRLVVADAEELGLDGAEEEGGPDGQDSGSDGATQAEGEVGCLSEYQ